MTLEQFGAILLLIGGIVVFIGVCVEPFITYKKLTAKIDNKKPPKGITIKEY